MCYDLTCIFDPSGCCMENRPQRPRVKIEMPTRKLLQLTSQELMQAWSRVARNGKILDISLKLMQCGHLVNAKESK